MAMNPRIWSKLPDHLLEYVLTFLPLKTFMRLRSTCKHFNSLVFSPCFISKHNSLSSSSSSSSSFILLSHPQFHEKCKLFNTATNSWSTISPSLPPSSHLLSSSNGLLCFSSSTCFLICNLLSGSLRRVKFPFCPFAFELLTLVPTTTNGNYKLFMLSSNSTALIYNSMDNSWQSFLGFDPLLNDKHHQKGVPHKGSLFFTTPEPFQLVGFHLGSGQWEKPYSGLPDRLTFVRLVSQGDREMYLIGGIGTSGISTSIKLWEMREDGKGWDEVETMPEMVCRKFVSVCYHNYEHVYCFWHQGLICVCCYTWPEILYYKVGRRTWHWLPRCPSLPPKWSCGFRWFSFKPQLYITL